MSTQTVVGEGPWPGPRPYREADRSRFFGRNDEKYELLERLEAERLVLLTSPSAVGKTSFLRACIVPELRRRRMHALEFQQPAAHSAVIVVRDWPIPDVTDTNSFVIEAIEVAILDLKVEASSYNETDARFILSDYERLMAVERSSSAFAYMNELASATDGLTLILDQFEEALQGSAVHVARLSDLIIRLFQKAPDVRLLLSFREEFLTRFNRIGQTVGDLPRRTYYLQPIGEATLRTMLLDSASVGNVSIAEEAIDEILIWMEGFPEEVNRATGDELRNGRNQRVVRSGMANSPSVDLLKLQALLLQLYRLAAGAQKHSDSVVITRETLEQLRAESNESGDLSGFELVERALQRFIDSLLPVVGGGSDTSGLPAEIYASDGYQQSLHRLRLRRAAARMGPSFSSGGFKVQQEQAALLARAWREEWEVLDLDVNDVEDAISRAELDGEHIDLFSGIDIGRAGSDESSEPLEDMTLASLSGIAKSSGWTNRETAIDMIETSLETLEILRNANVLRRKSLQGHVTYELVHDGFGDALFDWAENARVQPIDALTATTAERGSAFRWTRLSGVIRDVRWRGCWVGPDPDYGKRLRIDNVTFEHCDLRGTVFDRCDFAGGAFENCNLGGAVFWDCTFEGSADKPFQFVAIDASGLAFDDYCSLRHVQFCQESRLHNMSWNRLRVQDVAFQRCILNQMTIGDVTLQGEMTLNGCWLLLSDLVGLRAEGGFVESMLRIHNCDLFYCRLDAAAGEAAGRDPRNRRYPDPQSIGPEPELREASRRWDPWRQPG